MGKIQKRLVMHLINAGTLSVWQVEELVERGYVLVLGNGMVVDIECAKE